VDAWCLLESDEVDHRRVRGRVDQGLSVLRALERSTGEVRKNGRVTVSHAVAGEQRFNQLGIGQVEATVRHPLIPQADMLERRWVTCRCVSGFDFRPLFGQDLSPPRQFLLGFLPGILERPRNAVNAVSLWWPLRESRHCRRPFARPAHFLQDVLCSGRTCVQPQL
jgi:hypothetical protein